MDLVSSVQILKESVSISLHANVFVKSMNQFILPDPSYR